MISLIYIFAQVLLLSCLQLLLGVFKILCGFLSIIILYYFCFLLFILWLYFFFLWSFFKQFVEKTKLSVRNLSHWDSRQRHQRALRRDSLPQLGLTHEDKPFLQRQSEHFLLLNYYKPVILWCQMIDDCVLIYFLLLSREQYKLEYKY